MIQSSRQRVAIIGAGIFGVSCALELSENYAITLFEQADDVMTAGTQSNQYRHHYGFHYPRSKETVRQCLEADHDFRSRWQEAMVENMPSYYAVAKEGSRVTAEQFLKFCVEMNLKYKLNYPDPSFLNRDAVELCVETTEPVYDIIRMKKMARVMLANKNTITLKLSSAIVGGNFNEESDKKTLRVLCNGRETAEEFDYVVNATYGNHNLFRTWFNFPTVDLEFRLKELPVIKLPTKKPVAVTIMDGPFVTIVPIGSSGLFTLGDVPRSIIEIKRSRGGIPWTQHGLGGLKSRFEEMKIFDPYFIPIIKDAEYVKSMYTVLPILPNVGATDERVTSVTNHGRGCWSVFEGKIVTCVSAARDVAAQIAQDVNKKI